MPSQNDIDNQQLLADQRRTLHTLLMQQSGQGGKIFAHPGVVNGIADARAEIAQLKAALRGSRLNVEDLPGDQESLRDLVEIRGWWRYGIGLSLLIFTLGSFILVWVLLVNQGSAVVVSATPPALTSTAESSNCSPHISIGAVMHCSLSATGVDTYSLEATQGDQLLVVVARAVEINTEGIAPSFTLSQPGEAKVPGCSATNDRIAEAVCSISVSGTYVMTVQSQPSASTVYRIFVQRLNTPVRATPITLGISFTGEITPVDQIDSYTIEVPNAADIEININPNITNKANDLEPWFAIYSPNGDRRLCEAESPSIVEGDCNLPTAGHYTMLIADRRHQKSGTYIGMVRLRGQQ